MCFCVRKVACLGPWCKHAACEWVCRYACPLNPRGDDAVARACSNFVPGPPKDAFVASPSQACPYCAQFVLQTAVPAQQGGNDGSVGSGVAQGGNQQQQQQPAATTSANAGGEEEEEDEGEPMDLVPEVTTSLIQEHDGVTTSYGLQKMFGEMNIRR